MVKTPVEPTGDLLRYIIDNSLILEPWEQDICEVIRQEGRYYWPQIKTKYMNEGFATYWHEIMIKDLVNEGILTHDDHAEFTYANSLVKAMHPMQMNPYLIGSKMWEDIVRRWDMGQHGREWNECDSRVAKENWDKQDGKGHEKMMEVMKSYTDWFFVQDFLTPELVDDLKMYVYVMQETPQSYDFIRTKHTAEQVAKLIVDSFAHSHIPKIEIVNGNGDDAKKMHMVHRHSGADLNIEFASRTMKHIYDLWGREIILDTMVDDTKVRFRVDRQGKFQRPQMVEQQDDGQDVWKSFMISSPFENPNPVIKAIK